jgi:hypothetical protein
MIDPRSVTRRVTTGGSGNWGCWAVPGRAPRSRGRPSGGTGQATVRTMTRGQDVGDRAVHAQGDALPG